MGKKVNYAAGDNLPLYATPEQSLEYGKQWEEGKLEEQRRQRLSQNLMMQRQQQQQRKEKLANMPESKSFPAQGSPGSGNRHSSGVSGGQRRPVPSNLMPNNFPQQNYQQPPVTRPLPVVPAQQQSQQQPQQQLQYAPQYAPQYLPQQQMQQISNVHGQQPSPMAQQHYVSKPQHQKQHRAQQPGTPTSGISQASPSGVSFSSAHARLGVVPGSSNRSSSSSLNGDKQDVKEAASVLFHKYDLTKSGRLGANELQRLLQNDDTTPFSYSSVDSIINLFGVSRSGTLNLNEFIYMYHKIKTWRDVYEQTDANRSHTLTSLEFSEAVQKMGYKVPIEVVENLFDQFAEYDNGIKCLKFGKFVESTVWLIRLTKVFRKFDEKSNGVAVIDYKDFIDVSLYLGKFLPH